MAQMRTESVKSLMERIPRAVSFPKSEQGQNLTLGEIFGSRVFGMTQLQAYLPKPMFSAFMEQVLEGKMLDKVTADAVAHAVRVWAQERNATHYTHWFQPHTNATAEKHDSFLNLKHSNSGIALEVTALDAFSGSSLVQAEPDASSFPHGGVRTTFEARGYTVWDPTSPMFLQDGPHGTAILYIPSVFISYNGDALDEKTVLLRSMEALSVNAIKTLRLLGEKDPTKVIVTLGTEQEFFLVDRGLYSHRPDLKVCGRTLLGQVPPKHQQLEDHYFGNIPSRVLATISEAELELWKLGVPVKTRHNEVAPNQFEIAPIFEEANLAVDHNLLTMEVLHKVSHRHKLKVLFHEKPFKGVNGSGKHCNWSMATNTGKNLLDPTSCPEENISFLTFFIATLLGVYRYGGLLRAGIASASNDHRLGANEAPPAIISAFIGEHLTEVLNSIEERCPVRTCAKPEFKSVKVGGTGLDVKVRTLPGIARDLTDRNRTSPFAFTGNKFEFRAVGSKQSPSFPVTLLNTAVSSALQEVIQALEAKKKELGLASDAAVPKDAVLDVLRQFIKLCKPVRFEGNGYSKEWEIEAERRGLLNIKTAPESYAQLQEPKNVQAMVGQCEIFSSFELKSIYHVLVEKYSKELLIESKILLDMMQQQVIPSTFRYRRDLASGIQAIKQQLPGITVPEERTLKRLSELALNVDSTIQKLQECINHVCEIEDHEKQAIESKKLLPFMDSIRSITDEMESLTPDDMWPLPKYTDIFFS
jgi:glutamine synthetase